MEGSGESDEVNDRIAIVGVRSRFSIRVAEVTESTGSTRSNGGTESEISRRSAWPADRRPFGPAGRIGRVIRYTSATRIQGACVPDHSPDSCRAQRGTAGHGPLELLLNTAQLPASGNRTPEHGMRPAPRVAGPAACHPPFLRCSVFEVFSVLSVPSASSNLRLP